MDEEDRELDMSGMNTAQRVQYLERSLAFLRQQHADVLHALHDEVDSLKKENKGFYPFLDYNCKNASCVLPSGFHKTNVCAFIEIY